MKRAGGAFVAVVGSLLAACASGETANDRVSPETPLWFTHASGAMHVAFGRTLTAPARQVGEDYEHGRPTIDAANGRVFIGSADHGLYALRAGDLSTIWRFETMGVVQCEALYDPELDAVYFGSHDGGMYALNARDGRLLWRYYAGAEIARKPVLGGLGGETLYFANGSDQLFAVDRRTGQAKWQVHRTSALGMEIAGYAGPSVDGDLVYMAYSDGHVIAYDAKDGSEKWTPVDLSAEAEQSLGDAPRYLDVDTTPLVDTAAGGTKVVYVASYAGGVFALDANSGARVWVNEKATGATDLLLWQEPAHKPNPFGPNAGDPMVPAKKILIAASGVTGLWGIDPASGRMLWRVPVPEGGITAPAAVAGALMVGTTRYGLFLISPVNGKVIDGMDLGSGFAETPGGSGNRGYVLSNQGTLLGIQVDDPRPDHRGRQALLR